jgi:hypothetical protein
MFTLINKTGSTKQYLTQELETQTEAEAEDAEEEEVQPFLEEVRLARTTTQFK